MEIDELLGLESDDETGKASCVGRMQHEESEEQYSTEEHRETLSILVSSGKIKEFIGRHLSHGDVKKLSPDDVEKYYKRYESVLASKVNDTLLDGFLKLVTKGIGMTIRIDNTEKLHEDLKNDYIIQQELSSVAGLLSMKCGRLMACASAMLHVANHIVIEPQATEIDQASAQSAVGLGGACSFAAASSSLDDHSLKVEIDKKNYV